MATSTITPHILGIVAPDELRNLPGWLIWRLEHHDGEAKPRKIPYYTNGARRHGTQGRLEDRQQLTTFDAARAAAARKGFDGVGLALMPEWGISALDFDRCVGPDGLAHDVEALVAATYAEYSPSGEGVRAFVRGNLGNNKAPATATDFGFETFATKGFVTFTGNRLEICEMLGNQNTLAEATDEIHSLCRARFGRVVTDDDPLMTYAPRLELSDGQLRDALDVLDPDMDHDTWLQVGMALHHDTAGQGFAWWDEWSAKGAKYPGSETLRKRWESFGTQMGKVVTARTLVKLANGNGARINMADVTPGEFEAIEAPKADQPALRYSVIDAGSLLARKPPEWMVDGVIPRAELVVMFGDSGSGKSFLALDIAAAVARGVPWRDREVEKGRVIYIVAEGAGGFRNRLAAYIEHHGPDANNFDIGFITAAPNLLLKDDAIEISKAILTGGKADLVIVDTFAQTMPGANENSGEDVGRALAHCKGIHRATGATVLLVHHSGKDTSKGARGWSGLRAAADAEIEVMRTLTGRMVRISKQKDGDDGLEWGFELSVIPVGMDKHGNVIDSCVVKEAAVPAFGKTDQRKTGKWERLVIEVVGEIALSQNAGIEVEAVIEEVVRRSPGVEEGKRDTRKQHAKRALMGLCEGDEAPFFFEDGCISVL